MSLADRLAQARRDKSITGPDDDAPSTVSGVFEPTEDPYRDLKLSVHQSLIDSLGPKLYDANMTQVELEQRVRSTLQEVLGETDTPLTVPERARVAQEIADDILGP